MSQYYQETQRKEDVGTLQAMFGPPWTAELLGVVLDFYNGNVDETANKLLTLSEHHNGNPTPLVESLLLSGETTRQSAPTTAQILQERASSTSRGTVAQIPKSKMKKPPPPRKTRIKVSYADDSDKTATITIRKQTRKRIGTIQKLPQDFLRIPQKKQEPLFNPKTLDKLGDMPSDLLPNRNQQAKWNNYRRASAPLAETSNQPSKFQALRNSINFPSFPSTASKSSSPADNGHKDATKRSFFSQQGQENRARARSPSDGNNSLLSKFSVPKMTAPTITMPKIQLPSIKNTSPTSSTTQTSSSSTPPSQLKTAPPGPPGPPMALFSLTDRMESQQSPAPPPMGMFSRPNEDGHWFADNQQQPAQGLVTTSENDLLSGGGSYGLAPPESAPTDEKPGKWGLSIPAVPSLTKKASSDGNPSTTNNSSNNNNKSMWNFSPPSFAFSKNESESPPQESAPPLDNKSTRRWTLASMGSALKVSTSSANSPPTLNDIIDINDYSDSFGSIPQVEFRGVTLKQLQQLVENMRRHCVMEQWKSVETGRGLQPKHVSMYDLVRHYVIPHTQANSCSFVEQAFGKHHYEHGLPRPPQWYISHTWNDTVVDLVRCIEQHAIDRGLETDETAKYWISALSINQHQLGANVVADLDTLSDDSMLQDPRMTQRILQVTEGILCVIDKENRYFSRIWCLWEIFLALERAKVCLDSGDDRYLVDVYTLTDEEGPPVGVTDGAAQVDKYRLKESGSKDDIDTPSCRQVCSEIEWSELRVLRQSQFRYETCFDALKVNLESARASLEVDSRRIMNCIAQYKGINHGAVDSTHDAEALTLHPSYSHVNALIQGTFAGMCYRQALEAASKGDEQGLSNLKVVQAALSSSSIHNLEVCFAGCSAFQIREALKFVEILPISLQRLDLDYSFLDFQYAEEFAMGLGRLAPNLEVFKLNCAFCSKLSNLDKLFQELGKLINLLQLTLVIQPNKSITSVDGLTAALLEMPRLEKLELEFDCCGGYSRMVTAAKGGAAVNNISSIFRGTSDSSRLTQQFDQVSKLAHLDINGAYIDDSSITKLCRSIKSRNFDSKIQKLRLRFLGDTGKKLRDVETVEDLAETLQRIRNGLKLFS
ncbi:expressed unknown protein [Seminavis robusta]|uniref:CUE domain-containing protein n=1 Tax=Seminavis robusta TaxID=568900 RepID=A0A9N8H9F9_9STRA|nr:expressed unknown protein [Seminavis robusta]|eukprot:Sro190_g081830.1 n/a (1109) ;mRNA; f:38767-42093